MKSNKGLALGLALAMGVGCVHGWSPSPEPNGSGGWAQGRHATHARKPLPKVVEVPVPEDSNARLERAIREAGDAAGRGAIVGSVIISLTLVVVPLVAYGLVEANK
jgi:hypothetical protein